MTDLRISCYKFLYHTSTTFRHAWYAIQELAKTIYYVAKPVFVFLGSQLKRLIASAVKYSLANPVTISIVISVFVVGILLGKYFNNRNRGSQQGITTAALTI